MTDEQLVEQYLANGGQITKCPPRTYAIQEYVTWRDQAGADWQNRMAKNSPFAASRKSIPAGELFPLVGRFGVAMAAEKTGMTLKQIRERIGKAGLTEAYLKSQKWDEPQQSKEA